MTNQGTIIVRKVKTDANFYNKTPHHNKIICSKNRKWLMRMKMKSLNIYPNCILLKLEELVKIKLLIKTISMFSHLAEVLGRMNNQLSQELKEKEQISRTYHKRNSMK